MSLREKMIKLEEMNLKELNIKLINALCRKYKVAKLYLFGSVLTDNFSPKSDIDLIVEFETENIPDYFDNYFDFKYQLEEYFGRDVDLLENQAIKNPFLRKEIDQTKQLIYG